MKKILFVCLLLITTISLHAQTGSKDCLYRIKFYSWQWDYCKRIGGNDTVPKYSTKTGEAIGDTVFYIDSIIGPVSSYSNLTIHNPLPPSFINSNHDLTVTSFDETEKYSIESFEVIFLNNQKHCPNLKIIGSTFSSIDAGKFQELLKRNRSISAFRIDIKLKNVSNIIATSFIVLYGK